MVTIKPSGVHTEKYTCGYAPCAKQFELAPSIALQRMERNRYGVITCSRECAWAERKRRLALFSDKRAKASQS
jgi:hypothetical protein